MSWHGGTWPSLVKALDWGSRDREFKSPRPDNEDCTCQWHMKRRAVAAVRARASARAWRRGECRCDPGAVAVLVLTCRYACSRRIRAERTGLGARSSRAVREFGRNPGHDAAGDRPAGRDRDQPRRQQRQGAQDAGDAGGARRPVRHGGVQGRRPGAPAVVLQRPREPAGGTPGRPAQAGHDRPRGQRGRTRRVVEAGGRRVPALRGVPGEDRARDPGVRPGAAASR